MELINLQNNEEFMRRLADAKTPDEVQPLLAEFGVDMTKEDIAAALDQAEKELPEEDLENVAGGFVGAVVGGVAVLCFLFGLARGARCK